MTHAAAGVQGLHNTGSDCFASAILQALFNCPLPEAQHTTCPVSAGGDDVHSAYVRLRQAYRAGKLAPGMCNALLTTLRRQTSAVGSGPEDSQAFLTELLDRLCPAAKAVFTGHTESVLLCDSEECDHRSSTTEAFTSLMMRDLSKGIGPAYQHYSDWEYLPEAKCEKCGGSGMHKSISVKDRCTPRALVLLQKRPAHMNLGELKEAAKTHRLWAVVCNTGGHYLALVRSPSTGDWYVANDASVRPAGVDGKPPDTYRGVYMLFFAHK